VLLCNLVGESTGSAYVGCEFEALEMTPSFAASWKVSQADVPTFSPVQYMK